MKEAFNVNDYVLVQLKDHGRAIWRRHIESLHLRIEDYPLQEVDGFVRFQLWELMSIFGPYIAIGLDTPFETEIFLEKP